MKKINVVSLFCGGGGLDMGFTSKEFHIIYAIDFNEDAVNTYNMNFETKAVCQDINDVDIKTIPNCDIIIGGPPCQAFSLAGNRKSNDVRAKLVFKYMEIIKEKRPKLFLLENVTGLLSAKTIDKENVYDLLIREFKKIGYYVNAKVLNSADYGVPQRRKRVILVGTLDGISFEYPEPEYGEGLKKYVSVSEALSDLPSCIGNFSNDMKYIFDPINDYQKYIRNGSLFVTEHYEQKTSELDKLIIANVKPGGNYMDLPDDINSKRIQRLKRDGGHTTCYGRMNPDEPSYTINTYFNRPNVGANIHYSQNRLISVREALRLQSFPDTYKLVAKSKKAKNLIVGNAVPPLLAKALAKKVVKALEGIRDVD